MLERLVKMFRAIAANSQENRMDYANLAIMFGATLFKMEGEAHEMIFKLRRQCLILEDLMRHYSVIFLVPRSPCWCVMTLLTLTLVSQGHGIGRNQ